MIPDEFIANLKRNIWLYISLFLAGIFVYFAVLLGGNISSAYLWLLLPGVAFGVLGYLEYRRLERQKLLARLRAEWGVDEIAKERDFEEISGLFESAPQTDRMIDDRTWHDLNMDIVFSRIDRTFSWPGIQRLYQLLRSPEIDNVDKVEERTAMIASFESDSELREEVQVTLSKMDARIGSGLCNLLWGNPQVHPVHPVWVYQTMFVLALFSPLLLFAGARYTIAILFIFQINMYLHFKVQKRIRSHFEGVRSLRQLMGISRKLAAIKNDSLEELLSKIRGSLREVRQFTKIVRFVGLETTDPFIHVFEQYFAIFLLAEVRGFYRALDFIEDNREVIQDLFMSVGEVDALQSVASYRASLEYYCEPSFIKTRSVRLEEAYHPLLSDPVPNSIVAKDRGLLITGSNMSGKSTFLRTVGLNVLMAQTIGTCTSRSYLACPVRLLTSIGRSDNVVEGKSYYLEEALSVLRILEVINDDTTTLVIFDELYRGTNSEERIFAAQRVLEYLVQRNSLVFVATHDLELTTLLAHDYTSLHFSERVGQLGLEFDYKLKKGPATTKNAIALLRYLGYPEEITNQS